jgi:hypothetical protein
MKKLRVWLKWYEHLHKALDWILSTKKQNNNQKERIKKVLAGHWWLTPVMLASWDQELVEIRSIKVWSQLGQIVHETLSQKHAAESRADRVAQKKQTNKQTKTQKGPIICLQKILTSSLFVFSIGWPHICNPFASILSAGIAGRHLRGWKVPSLFYPLNLSNKWYPHF